MAIPGSRITPGNTEGSGIPTGMQPFAASIDVWYANNLTPEQWEPIGMLDLTRTQAAAPDTYRIGFFITVSRGTDWGILTVSTSETGTGFSSVMVLGDIAATQISSIVRANYDFSIVGTSTLQITISNGTYSISRTLTITVN